MPENKMEIKSETTVDCDDFEHNDLQRDHNSIKVERNHDLSENVSEYQTESSIIGGNVVADDEQETRSTDTKEHPSFTNEIEDIKNKESNFTMETKEINCFTPSVETVKTNTVIDDRCNIKPNVQKPSSGYVAKKSRMLEHKKIASHSKAPNKGETKDRKTNGIAKDSSQDTEATEQAVSDSKCSMCYKSIQCKHTTTNSKDSKVQKTVDNVQIESVKPNCDSSKKIPVTSSIIRPNEKKRKAKNKQNASNKNLSIKRRNKRT
ncbi:Hypothetical predicted protein [Mytilus galloprovincialis]|uniref:Uncharacterized protein n=1 Tax=Mytilus galloprovincialis TaxID=29158 RepID=A0A8B6GQD4_MYTGA|nr:Hypothetical predicted protein [Mytilus galloprovincialis]